MKAHLAYLCSSQSWGGLEMNHLRNAYWMQERGHRVTILAVNDSRYHKEALSMGLSVQIIGLQRKYYDWSAGRKLVAILQHEGISHLLIRSTRDMSITAFAKSKLKNRLHTSYFMEMQLGVKKTNLLHAIRQRGIDVWSCPLPWLKNQVESMTRFRRTLVEIPSGIDLRAFQEIPNRMEARKVLDLPEDTLLFGLIGRLDPQKGQLLLMQAMQQAQHKEFHAVFLGEPTYNEGDAYADELQHFVKEHQLEDRVHFRPFMAEPQTFYAAMDWMVMATKAETFGMVTLESLACGTPVLGSNAGGTPEILEHGKGGVLFESMNSADLARKLDTICTENPAFPAETLKQIVRKYDHNEVCRLVELHLNVGKSNDSADLSLT